MDTSDFELKITNLDGTEQVIDQKSPALSLKAHWEFMTL